MKTKCKLCAYPAGHAYSAPIWAHKENRYFKGFFKDWNSSLNNFCPKHIQLIIVWTVKDEYNRNRWGYMERLHWTLNERHFNLNGCLPTVTDEHINAYLCAFLVRSIDRAKQDLPFEVCAVDDCGRWSTTTRNGLPCCPTHAGNFTDLNFASRTTQLNGAIPSELLPDLAISDYVSTLLRVWKNEERGYEQGNQRDHNQDRPH